MTWEDIGNDRWLLCVGFGDSGHMVALKKHSWGGGTWVLDYMRQDPSDRKWYDADAEPWIARLESDIDLAAAQHWALLELASLARDRAKRYTEQLYLIMIEAARAQEQRAAGKVAKSS